MVILVTCSRRVKDFAGWDLNGMITQDSRSSSATGMCVTPQMKNSESLGKMNYLRIKSFDNIRW